MPNHNTSVPTDCGLQATVDEIARAGRGVARLEIILQFQISGEATSLFAGALQAAQAGGRLTLQFGVQRGEQRLLVLDDLAHRLR
jgi:hypothetical protein